MSEHTIANNIQNEIHAWEKVVQLSATNNKRYLNRHVIATQKREAKTVDDAYKRVTDKMSNILDDIENNNDFGRKHTLIGCDRYTGLTHNAAHSVVDRLFETYKGYPFTIEKCFYNHYISGARKELKTSQILLDIPTTVHNTVPKANVMPRLFLNK